LLETHVPKYFGFFEEALKNNSSPDFLVGDSYTITDAHYVAIYASFIGHPSVIESFASTLAEFPLLKEYFEKRMEAQKDYFDKRPVCSF
jgi:glutathione S-transferase